MPERRNWKYLLIPGLAVIIFATGLVSLWSDRNASPVPAGLSQVDSGLKLYWFIPDGFRADPELFNIYTWANEGKLPNIRRMMERGSYGYSRPVFPGHTPTNFATLLTGTHPEIHGVADGPMHIAGYPLSVVSKNGFSSIAKKVPPIWFNLERSGHEVTVLSVPGSTPPELSAGTTIRGRWGGWGIDFPAMIFQSDHVPQLQMEHGLQRRAFEFGPELTRYQKYDKPSRWQIELPASFSEPYEITLENWGNRLFGYVYDSVDDSQESYDSVLFSSDKSTVRASLRAGEWSDWISLDLKYQQGNDYNIHTPKKHHLEHLLSTIDLSVLTKIHIIRLGAHGEFRIRLLYDNLNNHSVKPSHVADRLRFEAGPMVDFVDNFPPQLIYFPEDKATFLNEAELSLEWHQRAAKYLAASSDNNVVIHDIYTPNQMLTSRWWLRFIDPASSQYNTIDEPERALLFQEVLDMYQGIDRIVGEIMDSLDDDTVFVLSSDHGVVPFNREVHLNNVFANHGLLEYEFDQTTGEYRIVWERTRAVFLKMDGIYLNPDGLGGNYRRASGPAYETLKGEVIAILDRLSDNGVRPVDNILSWEEASEWQLPTARVADLVIANKPGYGWVEEITSDGVYFSDPLPGGYKQAIHPDQSSGMLTPFIVIGPGVRKNHSIDRIIDHVDQYPTIMTLIDEAIPDFVQGEPVREIMKHRE